MYVDFREATAASKVRRTVFRLKKYGWKMYSVLFEFEDDTKYEKTLVEDDYMRGFISDVYLRPSCYDCAFKGNNYHSDITLADFWGIENACPEMNDDKGSKIHITGHEKCVNELYTKIKSVKDLGKKTNKQILKEINYIHKEC
jgi:hypothetical protein